MKIVLVFVAGLFSLGGCMVHNYGPIEPINPKETGFITHTAVDSLQPTLQWSDKNGSTTTTYMLGVWKAIAVNNNADLVPGEQVYLKDNIVGTSHTLEKPLAPRTIYFWSVKHRADANWAISSTWYNMGSLGQQWEKNYFLFRTLDR